jgi:Polyketide synthase dehydratase
MEWLRDHQIEGTTVFPGAGYIVSAIEAVRLLTGPSEETARGYRLRDIDIMKALVILESVSVSKLIFRFRSVARTSLTTRGGTSSSCAP